MTAKTHPITRARFRIRRLVTLVFIVHVGAAWPVHGQEHDHRAVGYCGGVIAVPTDEMPDEAARGGAFSINAFFNVNITPAQQAVIQQAINEWQGIIRTAGINPNNLPVVFQNSALNGNLLGLTTTTYNNATGAVISALVRFDNRAATTWFIDPTPNDDSEFDETPPAGWDYLSVARHEIGHAVGFIIPTGAPNPAVNAFISGNTFDANRLNIGITTAGGGHIDPAVHADDLMVPGIAASTRVPISLYPSASFLARAFQYNITMNYVDGGFVGPETGSANTPWNTGMEGLSLTPVGRDLLLIPGTYQEPMPIVHDTRLTIGAARGGSAVITGP